MESISAEWIVPIIASSVILILAAFSFILVIYFQKRRQQHTIEMTKLKQSYKQELLQSQLEIQEEALRYINQEIHDNIGQVLSLAKLYLNTLPLMPQDENWAAIDNTKQLVGKAIRDLRGLSKSSNPDRVNKLGLEANIRHELGMLEKTREYSASLQLKGMVYPIPIETQTILFSMVQACISNIIKHAVANVVEVIMDYEPHRFSVLINDNGIGFNVDELANNFKAGNGLKNMLYRSKIIGALFLIEPAIDDGMSIRICLPREKLLMAD